MNAEFEAVLRQCLDGSIGPDTLLHRDTDLRQFGIDSLAIVRLLVTIEDAFGVIVPDEVISFEIFSSAGTLWDVVSGLAGEQGED
ncbi:hypothetical protein MB27_12860 [Actinoplanes utahensis]|uniref:Carrier domain-containing protein n=1 Tax=Actinoplanes utahensis TaxID=1869 RepID=A0A0A6UQ22_ACTUT|nr:hypothetical protein MB27_12860 [Actinoplanes utahensis]